MPTLAQMIAEDFGTVPEILRLNVAAHPDKVALIQDDRSMRWGELDAMMDRVAAGLQRDGVQKGQALSVCATTSIEYAASISAACGPARRWPPWPRPRRPRAW